MALLFPPLIVVLAEEFPAPPIFFRSKHEVLYAQIILGVATRIYYCQGRSRLPWCPRVGPCRPLLLETGIGSSEQSLESYRDS